MVSGAEVRRLLVSAWLPGAFATPPALFAGSTDLQQTTPLVWVMLAFSVAGALVTFGILVWALYRFRDPGTKGRRYG